MKPVTIDLMPTEAMHLVAVLGIYAKARDARGKPAVVTRRIAAKLDKALLDATAREDAAK